LSNSKSRNGSSPSLECPCLRTSLEVSFVSEGGQELIVLLDRLRIAPGPLMVPKGFAPVLSMFDGAHSKEKILSTLSSHGLTAQILDRIIEELDTALLLDSPKFKKEESRIKTEFAEQEVRRPSCAGAVYPADKEALTSYLNEICSMYGGDGKGTENEVSPSNTVMPLGIIIPHIDFARGAPVYARVSNFIKNVSQAPDVIIILGTSHYGGKSRFQFSLKDYSLPGAVFRNAREITEGIVTTYGAENAYQDEFLHKVEHSIELPLVFLWNSWKERKKLPKIVPILVSSFYDTFDVGDEADSTPDVSAMIDILCDQYRQHTSSGLSVQFVCGVDLCHVGQGFGDPRYEETDFERLADFDREIICALEEGSAKTIDTLMRECRDAYRVCGYPSLYLMLKVFERLGHNVRGELIDYSSHTTRESDTTVSFAGMSMMGGIEGVR